MKTGFSDLSLPVSGTVAVFVQKDSRLTVLAEKLDKATKGALTRAMKASRFTGKREETLSILAPAGVKVRRILLVGTGDPSRFGENDAQAVGAAVFAALAKSGETEVTVLVDGAWKGISGDAAAAHMACGAMLRSYRFDRYRTTEKPEQKPALKTLTFGTKNPAAAKKVWTDLEAVVRGVFLTRDMVSEPPNILYPETMMEQCRRLAALGVKVDVLDEKRMKKLGMGALLGVAQGSVNPPFLVTMHYNGHPGAKDKRPVALVGKGVTFDTGGISIKPADGMWDMKYDMAGAGAVIGAIHALAARKAKVNVVGAVGLVENMPSGTAQRPGDIVTTMSGQTVEVLNTDAEGRLVLADVLWYTQGIFKPRAVVDLATLTGAIAIALGREYAGLFSNDDTLSRQLTTAGEAVDEKLWRMPMGEAYDRDIDGEAGDIRNMGQGREAGSITAAQFLKRFIHKGIPWAHLDIAAVAWAKKDRPVVPKGASGFGVRLLERFVADNFES
ncbi:MAG: leucyl aminopeptidase [Pseudomonadota bacterium]|nr:leucyl aminopeptidase [Pseudomonadota bacterium]